MLTQLLKKLDKKGIHHEVFWHSIDSMVVTLEHRTIKYKVDFLIRVENDMYDLSATYGNGELLYNSVQRKTPQTILNYMISDMNNLPSTIDRINMGKWEESMEMRF